jgi:anti-sigma factor RsiW
MTDSEMIQRLLDGELDADAEAQLRFRAAKDPRLAEELAAYEAIVYGTARLPRPSIPPGLDARVLANVASIPPSRPLSSPLQFLHAEWFPPRGGAIAAVCAVLIALAGVGIGGYRLGAAHARAELRRSEALESMNREVVVRFSLTAPKAANVELAGDFNGWKPAQSPLSRTPSGVWSTTVRLSPGRHEYLFFLDGQRWVPDPSAAEIVDDGFGGKNAVIEVL